MIAQAAAFTTLYVGGVSIALALHRRADPLLCATLGFFFGLFAWVLVGLVLLSLRVPYTLGAASSGLALIVAASWVVIGRRGVSRGLVRACGLGVGAFAALSLAAAAVNVSVLARDGHELIIRGRAIAAQGALSSDLWAELASWGVSQIMVQSLAPFLGLEYLSSLALVFGLSFVAIFCLLLWRGLDAIGIGGSTRWAVVVLVALALFSINFVLLQFGYIHTNFPTAAYLSVGVALWWLAEQREDPTLVPLACVCLVAFAFQRIETSLVSLFFFVILLAETRLPRRLVTRWLVFSLVPVILWNAELALHIRDGAGMLSATQTTLVSALAITVGTLWVASQEGLLRRLRVRAPVILMGLMVLITLAFFLTKPDHMLISWNSMLKNARLGSWGHTWQTAVLLAILAWPVARIPRGRVFTYGVPLYILLVLLMAYFREPYRSGWGDSANRMLLHVTPVSFFALALAYAPYVDKLRTLRVWRRLTARAS